MKKNLLKTLVGLLLIVGVAAYAGTGGSEVTSWYNDMSGALKGFWGKIIALFFIGLAIMLFRQGTIMGGMFMGFLGLSIGTIPEMIDAKYTAIMYVANDIAINISILGIV